MKKNKSKEEGELDRVYKRIHDVARRRKRWLAKRAQEEKLRLEALARAEPGKVLTKKV